MRRSAALLRAAQSASRAAAAAPEASLARHLTSNAQVFLHRHAMAAAAGAHAPERRALLRMQACNACLPGRGAAGIDWRCGLQRVASVPVAAAAATAPRAAASWLWSGALATAAITAAATACSEPALSASDALEPGGRTDLME